MVRSALLYVLQLRKKRCFSSFPFPIRMPPGMEKKTEGIWIGCDIDRTCLVYTPYNHLAVWKEIEKIKKIKKWISKLQFSKCLCECDSIEQENSISSISTRELNKDYVRDCIFQRAGCLLRFSLGCTRQTRSNGLTDNDDNHAAKSLSHWCSFERE